jgi:beta-galactosidase
MNLKHLFLAVCLGTTFGLTGASAADAPAKHTFTIGENDFLLDGQRFQIRCGEVHAPRVPKEYWQHRLQMAKAMGLNTVCAYLFWNMHEPRPGEFNWSGQADLAEFCRLAQEAGLWVVLRPGPYACAEWEMGGLPWWLLKYDDIKLRTRDPRFIEATRNYMKEVGRVLGPMQITHGGPIIMVQVENEHGFFANDAKYMGEMRQALLDAGFDVPLFACNPPYALKNGYRADLFPVVNFGSDPAGSFKALRGILPKGPLMCGEFYPAWFDTWGQPHHAGDVKAYLTDLEYMLKTGASLSIYMAHGGTTFGLWSGADRPFKPDTSSYDYEAPISEAGWPTDKFWKTRELISKYLLPGETIPEPPVKNPVIAIPAVEFNQCAPVFANLPAAVKDEKPRTMEKYDQDYGSIIYRTKLPAGPAATLEAAEVRDFGLVFLNGERIGVMDRRSRNFKVNLPERKATATLDILVYPMGRVNFGQEVHDRKGLYAPVKLKVAKDATELTGWEIFNLPVLDSRFMAGLKYGTEKTTGPAFWRATLDVKEPADTFLDLRHWSKGVVWVNGRCLARFWNIGPTQTAYLPGPWLKPGPNDIVIMDLFGPEQPVVAGLAEPILNQLRPTLDFARSRRPEVQLALEGAQPVMEAQFSSGAAMQEVKLPNPAKGRFFCLESKNAHDGKALAAIAELDLLDADGKPLSHDGWTIAYVDSEERLQEDGTAENAIDGQTANFWQTESSAAQPNHPHRLILDLGSTRAIGGFRYVPRQGTEAGRIKDYRIYVGDELIRK